MKRFFWGAFFVALLWVLPLYGGKQPLPSDEVVLPPSLVDQHGRMREIDAQLRTLLFAPDRQAGKIVHALLEKGGEAYLNAHSALVVADIARMPSLVARFLALPRMREYSYPLLLCREEGDCADLPRREEQVTVLFLEQRRIVAVSYVQQPDHLHKVLGKRSDAAVTGADQAPR